MNASLVASLVLACGGDGATRPDPVLPANVTITGAPADGIIVTGTPTPLTAAVRGPAGQVIDHPVTWTSSSNGIATVSPDGIVTPVMHGTITITASAGGVNGSQVLSVRQLIPMPAAGAGPLTTSFFNGAITVTVPPGASSVPLHLGSVGIVGLSRIQGGTAFEIGPSAVALAAPMTITVRYDETGLGDEVQDKLRIYRVAGPALTLVPEGTVDRIADLASASISDVGRYAIATPTVPASIEIVSGNGQSAGLGAAVPLPVVVRVRDTDGTPTALADVIFEASGGSWIPGAFIVRTGTDGLAALDGWHLAHLPGTNVVQARVVTATTVHSTNVTASAVSPPGINVFVASAPAMVAFGFGASVELHVDLTNRGSLDLGGLALELRWDPARFALHTAAQPNPGWVDSQGSPVTVTVDESNIAGGRLLLSGQSANPTTSSFQLRFVILSSQSATSFVSTIEAVILSATNGAGTPITVSSRPVTVTMSP